MTRWTTALVLSGLVLGLGATYGRPLAMLALGAESVADHEADMRAMDARLGRIERVVVCTYLAVRFGATREDCETLEIAR